MALITVMGVAGVLGVLMTTVAVQAITNLRQVSGERIWEQALHVGEAGVDHTLFRLRNDRGYDTGETFPLPAPAEGERAWVLEAAEDAADDSGRLFANTEGQWISIKPANHDVVYAVGYSPSYANPTKVRIVRVEYDFPPFVPGAALLIDGDLSISGNPGVNEGPPGSAHANGNVTITGSSARFDGYVSASGGSCSGCTSPIVGDSANSGPNRPPVEIPVIEPFDYYVMSEYDLCPDGSVHAGPAYTGTDATPADASSTVPCTGGELADSGDTNGNGYRGWKSGSNDSKLGRIWDYGGNTAYDGVYYFYQGSAKVGGTPGTSTLPWRVTIITHAQGDTCPHVGGDIEISGNPNTRFHQKAQPLLLISGRDLKISGNPNLGTGEQNVIAAREQIDISGNPQIYGATVASDLCDTSNSLDNIHANQISGNPTIIYTGGLEMPVGKKVRITRWEEL